MITHYSKGVSSLTGGSPSGCVGAAVCSPGLVAQLPTGPGHLFSEAEIASEEWRPVAGCSNYEISSLGRVRSHIRGRVKILKQSFDPRGGYWQAKVRDDVSRRRKTMRTHRLVLEAFVGPRPAGAHARHFPDNDTSNNRLANLSWSTPQQNILDRHVHGTMSQSRARHSDAEARAIIAEPLSTVELARKHGVSTRTIARWRSLGGASRKAALCR